MRLKLTLKTQRGAAIALNNRYELQAVIYSIIEKADNEFSEWLHSKGYDADGRNFKLFTFGWLDAYPYEQGNGFQISKEGRVTWELSFCVDKIIESFVAGLFQDTHFKLKAGFLEEVLFRVENVEILQPPNFTETMRYSTITPILISKKEESDKQEQYLSPLDEGYAELFIHNLRGKVKAAQGDAFVDSDNVTFRLLSPPDKVRKKPVDVHKKTGKTRYIPYLFDFELIAPSEWQKIGFLSGFGRISSQGLGMCREVK
jgi:CRISPR-associated endoribonuclease Cas6